MCKYCENDGYYKRNKSLISKTLKNNVDIDLAINVKDKKLVASIVNLTMNVEDNNWFLPTKKINFCPMCRKEARRVKVLKKGKYQKENIITCEKCGCEFQYYDTEIIVDMTTPDEESFLGGFGVHKYLKCPTCNAICTISTDFIEHKSIFTEIKEWWKDLFYASTSKEDKQ